MAKEIFHKFHILHFVQNLIKVLCFAIKFIFQIFLWYNIRLAVLNQKCFEIKIKTIWSTPTRKMLLIRIVSRSTYLFKFITFYNCFIKRIFRQFYF